MKPPPPTPWRLYAFAAGLAVVMTLPFAYGTAWLMGWGPLGGAAYALAMSFIITNLAIWSWRRKFHQAR